MSQVQGLYRVLSVPAALSERARMVVLTWNDHALCERRFRMNNSGAELHALFSRQHFLQEVEISLTVESSIVELSTMSAVGL
jgi:hypothetical protein